MKIVIAGGRAKSDFLIKLLLEKKHKVVVINDDKTYCEYLSTVHNMNVVYGNPCQKYVLDDAGIENFNVMIALMKDDSDNLAICQMASKIYNINKTVCIVGSPRNVEIFKSLGVTSVISSTYIVASMLEKASVLDSLTKSLELEEEQAVVFETVIEANYPVCNKQIMDIKIPRNVIIASIIRNKNMMVPNGSTTILESDKLIIVSSIENQDEALEMISKRNGR